jgi:hypothetical protein
MITKFYTGDNLVLNLVPVLSMVLVLHVALSGEVTRFASLWVLLAGLAPPPRIQYVLYYLYNIGCVHSTIQYYRTSSHMRAYILHWRSRQNKALIARNQPRLVWVVWKNMSTKKNGPMKSLKMLAKPREAGRLQEERIFRLFYRTCFFNRNPPRHLWAWLGNHFMA